MRTPRARIQKATDSCMRIILAKDSVEHSTSAQHSIGIWKCKRTNGERMSVLIMHAGGTGRVSGILPQWYNPA